MSSRIMQLRASQILKRRLIPRHVEIIALDVSATKLFSNKKTTTIVSLDASRLGLEDVDLEALGKSPFLHRLQWLSLAGNAISRKGVAAICRAVRDGRLSNLLWLDLRGTDCDATPYLDGGYEEFAVWRMPRISRELCREFGPQHWMMLGSRKIEKENNEYISSRNYPPNRLNLSTSER